MCVCLEWNYSHKNIIIGLHARAIFIAFSPSRPKIDIIYSSDGKPAPHAERFVVNQCEAFLVYIGHSLRPRLRALHIHKHTQLRHILTASTWRRAHACDDLNRARRPARPGTSTVIRDRIPRGCVCVCVCEPTCKWSYRPNGLVRGDYCQSATVQGLYIYLANRIYTLQESTHHSSLCKSPLRVVPCRVHHRPDAYIWCIYCVFTPTCAYIYVESHTHKRTCAVASWRRIVGFGCEDARKVRSARSHGVAHRTHADALRDIWDMYAHKVPK